MNIFKDIIGKASNLSTSSITVVDIGCGCSKPVRSLIDHTKVNNQRLILVDSSEMLANLPDEAHVVKCSHEFPHDDEFLRTFSSAAGVVIIYSVLHAIADFQNPCNFLDKAIDLLAPGGELLIGDIANISKKKRFLSSTEGSVFHEKWSSESCPPIEWNCRHSGFDDSILLQLLLRYRLMGFESYLLPQGAHLPLGYTREDLLVRRYS